MKRWAVLAIALLFLPVGQAFSDATSTPRADCTGIDAYVVQVQGATREYLEELHASGTLAALPPDQMRALAATADAVASALRLITPPAIAEDYHATAIMDIQIWANFLRDAATLGFFAAAILHFESSQIPIDPVGYNPYQGLLAQRCEAFQPLVVWLNTYPDAPTAPAASPVR